MKVRPGGGVGGGVCSLLVVSLPSITKALGSVSSSTEEVEEMKGCYTEPKPIVPGWLLTAPQVHVRSISMQFSH